MDERKPENTPENNPEPLDTSEVPAAPKTPENIQEILDTSELLITPKAPEPTPEVLDTSELLITPIAPENTPEVLDTSELLITPKAPEPTPASAPAEPPVQVANPALENSQRSGLSGMLTSTRVRLQLARGQDWREVVYSQEIDSLLATLAMEEDEPPVSEAAARAIGRIRSEAAVKVLAERQRKGERRALRALALVRDEAPSLPKSVSRQARLYTWLANTWRRLSDRPLRLILRYLCAAFFGGLAMGFYAYTEYSAGARDFGIQLVLDIWGKTLTNSIAFGVVFGLVVLLAAEIPERLRGFWPWWSRLILNLVLGIFAGSMIWTVFNLFFLYNLPLPGDERGILVGGLCLALAFTPSALFRIPGWLGAIWAAIMFAASLTISFYNWLPPLIYILQEQTIEQFAIPMGLLIGIGAYLPQIIGEARGLVRGMRTPPAAQGAAATATAIM
jgi:hypothetical protein